MHTLYENLILGNFSWRVDSRQLIPLTPDASAPDSGRVALTPKQYQLLKCLYDAHPNTLTKEQIIENVWGTKHTSPESLPQLIIRTRTALEDVNKRILVNVPGVGYSLRFAKDEPNVGVSKPVNPTVHIAPLPALNTPRVNAWYVCVGMIGLLTTANLLDTTRSLYYAWDFQQVHQHTPYPHVNTREDGTITVTIDNHECIYRKNQLLLQCQ